LSQLVAFYDEKPVALKGQVEIYQAPITQASGTRSVEGAIRPSLVYVQVPSEAGPFLVPFGEYDNWSLRDRYNEAIRIMNTLGASEITCETFGEVTTRRGLRAKIRGRGAQVVQRRIENSGFDFRHSGAGSAPRDPRPLRWPDEPGFAAAVSSVLENGATDAPGSSAASVRPVGHWQVRACPSHRNVSLERVGRQYRASRRCSVTQGPFPADTPRGDRQEAFRREAARRANRSWPPFAGDGRQLMVR